MAFPNSGIQCFCFSKIEIQCFCFSRHWNSVFCLSQTFEFKNFAFPYIVKYFSVLPYPNIAILDFGVFNIGIHCFGCSKHCTLLVFPNIGVLYFSLSKHCNSVFLIIRTLEFSAFTFANIGILNFAFSKQCNSVFYLFQTLDFPLWVSFSRH